MGSGIPGKPYSLLRIFFLRELDMDLPTERTLGVQWDMESDKFVFSSNLKDSLNPSTRRGILSLTSSIFDPIGYLAPVVLPAKLLLQDLCRDEYGWDEQIPEREAQRW